MTKKWYLLSIFFILTSNSYSFAEGNESYRQEIEAFQIRMHEEMKVNSERNDFRNEKIKANIPKNKKQSHERKNPSILIFVSFSMPKESLERYLRDAKRVGANVVVRGLIDNSFQKTMKEMSSIINKTGYGFELNPIWFKTFSIRSVPSVVIVSDKNKCIDEGQCNVTVDFDLFKGNTGLLYALKRIRDEGDFGSNVNPAMSQLSSLHHA